VRQGQSGLVPQFPKRCGVERLVVAQKPARKRELAAVGLVAPLDEQHAHDARRVQPDRD
jgi:hypothetical protein